MVKEVFLTALITYVVLTIVDKLIPGFVSRQFNMEVLLGIVLLTGVLSVFLLQREPPSNVVPATPRSRRWLILYASIFGLLAAILVWLQTAQLGWISIPMAVVSGLTLVALALLLQQDDDDEKSGPDTAGKESDE